MDEQIEFVKEIARRLDGASIPYMLTGSLAMTVYAEPRMTRDIDLVVDAEVEDAHRLALLFSPDCYIDEDDVTDALARRSMFNVIHNQWLVKADFIIRKNTPYRQAEFSRRRRVDVAGTPVAICAREDLILSKLYWARESGSDTQRRDAAQLLLDAPDLDWPYMSRWAQTLGVAKELAKLKNP